MSKDSSNKYKIKIIYDKKASCHYLITLIFLSSHETINGVLERKLAHKYTKLLWSCTNSELEKGHVLVPKVRLVHFTTLFKAGLDTTEEISEMITINTTNRLEKFWCACKQSGY